MSKTTYVVPGIKIMERFQVLKEIGEDVYSDLLT